MEETLVRESIIYSLYLDRLRKSGYQQHSHRFYWFHPWYVVIEAV